MSSYYDGYSRSRRAVKREAEENWAGLKVSKAEA
jgi:hypothetical protein